MKEAPGPQAATSRPAQADAASAAGRRGDCSCIAWLFGVVLKRVYSAGVTRVDARSRSRFVMSPIAVLAAGALLGLLTSGCGALDAAQSPPVRLQASGRVGVMPSQADASATPGTMNVWTSAMLGKKIPLEHAETCGIREGHP